MATYKIRPGNNFGVSIIELIQEEFGGDYDLGIASLMEATGFSEEDVVGLIEEDSELAIDEELLDAVASVFESTSTIPEVYNGLYMMALDANGELDLEETLAAIEEEDEDDDYEYDEDDYDYEEVEDEDEVEASYNYGGRNAEFMALQDKVNSIETLFAVKEELSTLTAIADQGVEEGWLPPIGRTGIVGAFSREDDQVAAFSQMCGAANRSADEMLFAMGYALNLFKRCGSLVDFKQYVEGDDADPEVAAFSAAVDEHARRSLEAMELDFNIN